MTRGSISKLASPAPMATAMPAIYQEDDMAVRLMSAFDEVLAPAFTTLDNFTAYIDPAMTPDDFLDWLAGWVGLLLDETWPIERRRAFIALAAELYRARGTMAGLADQVRLFTAGEVEIVESGGSAWSTTADAAPPGSAEFSLVVRVKPPAKTKLDASRLEALVAAAKPAHVSHRVEVVARGGG